MKLTKRQKAKNETYSYALGSNFWKQKYTHQNIKLPIHPIKFRLVNFRNLILSLKARKKGEFLSSGACFTKGIFFDFKTDKFRIRTNFF